MKLKNRRVNILRTEVLQEFSSENRIYDFVIDRYRSRQSANSLCVDCGQFIESALDYI